MACLIAQELADAERVWVAVNSEEWPTPLRLETPAGVLSAERWGTGRIEWHVAENGAWSSVWKRRLASWRRPAPRSRSLSSATSAERSVWLALLPWLLLDRGGLRLVGCQNLIVAHAARSYVWWSPPSTGRARTGPWDEGA